jgi:cytochrome d ubiquinol oxidase subunit II
MFETIWFVIWGVAWAVYFMLDGFDLGLGTLFPFLARDEGDKRILVNAMGPFWDGNEVWLITAGGVTFAAFPRAYAVMFSTLYTPLMLLLFALILRGVSFEFRGKVDSPAWRRVWDTCLVLGSFLPALLLGVAFANIFAGIPFDAQGRFHGTLLTLLNPYGLLGGVLFVLIFAVHGALWLATRTRGALQARADAAVRGLWPFLAIVAVAFLVMTGFATPLWRHVLATPALLVLPLLAVAGLFATRILVARKAWWKAWFASSALILGAVLFGVAGLFPALLPSSLDPAATCTAFNSASSPLTLKIMLGVVLCFLPVVIAYQTWVLVTFRGVVDARSLAEDGGY